MEMSNNEVMITSIATHTGSAFKKVCMLPFFLFFLNKNKKISSLLKLFGSVNDLFLEWNVGIILARFGEFEHKRKLMPSYFRILCSILPTDIVDKNKLKGNLTRGFVMLKCDLSLYSIRRADMFVRARFRLRQNVLSFSNSMMR